MADHTFTYRGKSYDIEDRGEFFHVFEDGTEICMYCKATDRAAMEPSSLSERGINELLNYLCSLS